VFDDAATLALAASLVAQDPAYAQLYARPRLVTAYVLGDARVAALERERRLEVSLAIDPDVGGTWPLRVHRLLRVHPSDTLHAILERDLAAGTVDPLYLAPELKRLLRLVLNAVLYSTSAQLDPILLPPRPGRRRRGRRRQGAGTPPGTRPRRSREGVYFLPGRIDVARVRRLRELEETDPGRKLMRRFLVRGHWRRASQTWKDWRLRWIEPYWKGPTLGDVIEREYRLRP
jgi:hypothetical protein